MKNSFMLILLCLCCFSQEKCECSVKNQLITKAYKIDNQGALEKYFSFEKAMHRFQNEPGFVKDQASVNVEELHAVHVSSEVMCTSVCSAYAECGAVIFPAGAKIVFAKFPCKLMKMSLTHSYSVDKEESIYLLDRGIEVSRTETFGETTSTTNMPTTTAYETTTTTTYETTTTTSTTTQATRSAVKEERIKRHNGADVFGDQYILFYDYPTAGVIYLAQTSTPAVVQYQKYKKDIFPTFEGHPFAAFNFNGQLYLQNNGTEGVWRTFELTKSNDQLGIATATPNGISHPLISATAVYATRIGTDSVIMKLADGSIKCYHGDDITCQNCTKDSPLKMPSEKCLKIATNLNSDPRYAQALSLIGHYDDFLAYTTYDASISTMYVHDYED